MTQDAIFWRPPFQTYFSFLWSLSIVFILDISRRWNIRLISSRILHREKLPGSLACQWVAGIEDQAGDKWQPSDGQWPHCRAPATHLHTNQPTTYLTHPFTYLPTYLPALSGWVVFLDQGGQRTNGGHLMVNDRHQQAPSTPIKWSTRLGSRVPPPNFPQISFILIQFAFQRTAHQMVNELRPIPWEAAL